ARFVLALPALAAGDPEPQDGGAPQPAPQPSAP
ncbi:MAG: hypothetical protein QOJ63_1785, partial [Solirubrobacteraceae bacterium]|nr:hypothetical protein [Solirubrobacteraceae bacterium]